ncbi:MAG: hypothetical protein MZV65_15665 [Chromatiales bacterium]|nr:hypothetical protein [Chromatiales bacterium]
MDPVEPPIGFRGIQAGDLTAWRPGYSSPHLSQLMQDIYAVLGTKPTPSGAGSEGAVELDIESHRQRHELPKQQPKSKLSIILFIFQYLREARWASYLRLMGDYSSRRFKYLLLAVALVLAIGIISYWGYDLTSSTSLPTPEEEIVKDTTKDSAPVELEGKAKPVDSSTGTDAVTSPFNRGSLTTSGKGKEFYYVYDASGKKELGFKYTGTTIELFPGTYQLGFRLIFL